METLFLVLIFFRVLHSLPFDIKWFDDIAEYSDLALEHSKDALRLVVRNQFDKWASEFCDD